MTASGARPRPPPSSGPVDQHETGVWCGDHVLRDRIGVDQRLGQAMAVVGMCDLLAKRLEEGTLRSGYLVRDLVEPGDRGVEFVPGPALAASNDAKSPLSVWPRPTRRG